MIRCTKPITMATAKAVSAGNSGKQEDVIVAANMGRKAISDLLTVCRVMKLRLRFLEAFLAYFFYIHFVSSRDAVILLKMPI